MKKEPIALDADTIDAEDFDVTLEALERVDILPGPKAGYSYGAQARH